MVTTPSIVGSAWSDAATAFWTPTGSPVGAASTFIFPPDSARPLVRPSQRVSSAALPTSSFTQIAFFTPIAPRRRPPARPATASSEPTWVRMPNCWNTSPPEFIETTGMPASTAFLICGPSALGSGIDTTSPSGLLATAASISSPIRTMSNVSGELYSTLTHKSFCACRTPFWTTAQKFDVAWPWVTTTIRTSFMVAQSAAAPVPEAATASTCENSPATRARIATTTSPREILILRLSPLRVGDESRPRVAQSFRVQTVRSRSPHLPANGVPQSRPPDRHDREDYR